MGEATLYINDEPVGEVLIQRMGQSWSHGEFLPGEAFSRFAPLFGRWSLLMHEGEQGLSESEADGLRQAEVDIDRLHAKLHVVARNEWVNCSQLNIDGPLIEWKSF